MKITIFPWDPQGDGSDEAEEARWCYVCGCGGALVGFLRWNGVEIRGKIPGKMDEDGENLGMNQRKMNEHLEIFLEKCWFFEWDLIHGDFFGNHMGYTLGFLRGKTHDFHIYNWWVFHMLVYSWVKWYGCVSKFVFILQMAILTWKWWLTNRFWGYQIFFRHIHMKKARVFFSKNGRLRCDTLW